MLLRRENDGHSYNFFSQYLVRGACFQLENRLSSRKIEGPGSNTATIGAGVKWSCL